MIQENHAPGAFSHRRADIASAESAESRHRMFVISRNDVPKRWNFSLDRFLSYHSPCEPMNFHLRIVRAALQGYNPALPIGKRNFRKKVFS